MARAEINIREYFTPVNIILVIFFINFLFLLRNDYFVFSSLRNQNESLQLSIKSEETLRDKLNKEIVLLDKEDYIESIARTQLNLIKPGEKAYKVIQ